MFSGGGLGLGLAVSIVGADDPVPSGLAAGERPARLSEIFPPRDRSDRSLGEELGRIVQLEAMLAAYKADLVVALGDRRPAASDVPEGRPGAAVHHPVDEEGRPELIDVSEFYADEVADLLNCSRAAASTLVGQSFALDERLPATRAALADGALDWPRARGLLAELAGPATAGTPPAVIAAVEAALLPVATEVNVRRLRELARRELLARDPAAADRRRKHAEKTADVALRGKGDGLAELATVTGVARAAAMHDALTAYARMLRADGDPRPIGQLRVQALEDLVLRPWDTGRPPVTVTLTVFAPLGALTHLAAQPTADAPVTRSTRGTGVGRRGAQPNAAARGPLPNEQSAPAPNHQVEPAPPTGVLWPPAELGGAPITAGQLRALLEQTEALCPGGLQPPAGGGLSYALTDPDGTLRATIEHAELRRLARRGCPDHPDGDCDCPLLDRPPEVDRYQPTPAQRRFVTTRDRTCRHPGCANRAGWADLDHVIPHACGGPTACENLCCLCRRHHRLKTHACSWRFTMSDDGLLTVTTPSGITRTTRPPGQIDHAIAVATAYDPADDPPPF